MASEVFDAPRQVSLTLPDGTRKKVRIMEAIMNSETGEMEVLNDVTNLEFDVYADIGPSYASKKEQTLEQLEKMAMAVAASDPNLHKLIILKMASLVDGVNMEDVREYANKQLVLAGFREPSNEEEMAMLQQAAQQGQKPDAATLLAMAEMEKAKADQMKAANDARAQEFKAQTDVAKVQVDQFKAMTDRAKVSVDAQKAGADINYTNLKASGQQIDNIQKITQPLRARVNA
jgi:hypothetical protein